MRKVASCQLEVEKHDYGVRKQGVKESFAK